MQRRIVRDGELLNSNGELREKGYATSLCLNYDRTAIKVPKWQIKEWDYYLITNEKYGVALTIADNGYMGLVSISLIDFRKPGYKTVSRMIPFTLGRIGLPATSTEGDVQYENKDLKIAFLNDGKVRKLLCKMKAFEKDKPFECEFILSHEPQDSMVIATPFEENKKAFYYNQKIVGMQVRGYAKFDEKLYKFKKESARGILDWGRGVWTYKNIWYWGAATGRAGGKEIGWNIGYGFGDTSAASENMIFYEGKAHKIENIIFNIPRREKGEYEYMKPWTITSSDGRFEMKFEPIIDRKDYSTIGIISSNQHQVFGRYSGTLVLDDGNKIKVTDMLGFAERVKNRW